MFKYGIIDLTQIAIVGREGLCTKEKNAVCDFTEPAVGQNKLFLPVEQGIQRSFWESCVK